MLRVAEGRLHSKRGNAMSETPKDPPSDQAAGASPQTPVLGRRLFILRVTAVLGSAAAAISSTTPAQAQNDNDLVDRGPSGKGQPRNPENRRAPRSGVTDQDPNDPQGGGRGAGGGQQRPGGGGRTGVTDKDPGDPQGQGRGTGPGRG